MKKKKGWNTVIFCCKITGALSLRSYVTFFKSDIWNGLSLGTYLVPNSKSKNGLRKRKWTLVIIGWCAQCLTSKLVQSMHVSIFSVSVHYKIV